MQAGSSIAQNTALLTEVCLRYPDSLGAHAQVTYETAVQLLIKAHQIAATNAFQFGYIDKPPDGSLFIVFLLPNQRQFPSDGIRFQDQETRHAISAGMNRELEVAELKFGFIPDSNDTMAYRVRRRFRLTKGGNPQLMLIHYSMGQPSPIIPALKHQPVRAYPLRPVAEPGMFVLGDKYGTRVPPQQRQPMPSAAGIPGMANMGGGIRHQANMLAQQSREMEALERRQVRERAAGMASHASLIPPDDDSGDELDHISTRSLALARYKRNHDYMNEVFMYAAFGDKIAKELPKPYACFKEDEMKEKIMKLEKEIQVLNERATLREAGSSRDRQESDTMDISMSSLREGESLSTA